MRSFFFQGPPEVISFPSISLGSVCHVVFDFPIIFHCLITRISLSVVFSAFCFPLFQVTLE